MPYEWHFGLTFGREEAKLLQGVAFLCLSNIWGFKCLNRSQQIVIEFDHHEEMWLYAATQQELDDLISSEVMPSHDRFEPI